MHLAILIFLTIFIEIASSSDTKAPKALNLETTAFKIFSNYDSGIKEAPFLYDTFYPIGYSSDKIAYIIEYDTDPADIVHIETIIQDLVTDKIIWHDDFRKEDDITNVTFKSFWEERHTKILEKLREHDMQIDNSLQLYQEKLYYKHDALFISSKSKKIHKKDWGSILFLRNSTIYLRSEKKGQKIIDQKSYNGEYFLDRKPIGYIPLGARGSKRVAVVVAKLHRGWEGPPHNIGYAIVGANLAVGFKR